jgi:hypothetical protein
VNLAIARSYAELKLDATIAVELILEEERQRWLAELYTRRVVSFLSRGG